MGELRTVPGLNTSPCANAVKFNLDAPAAQQQAAESAEDAEREQEEAERRSAWSPERATAEALVAALVEEWAAPMCANLLNLYG